MNKDCSESSGRSRLLMCFMVWAYRGQASTWTGIQPVSYTGHLGVNREHRSDNSPGQANWISYRPFCSRQVGWQPRSQPCLDFSFLTLALPLHLLTAVFQSWINADGAAVSPPKFSLWYRFRKRFPPARHSLRFAKLRCFARPMIHGLRV